jgi:hypothetical protein
VRIRARNEQPPPRGRIEESIRVGRTSAPDVRAVSLDLVGRPTVDLKRTDSALCR